VAPSLLFVIRKNRIEAVRTDKSIRQIISSRVSLLNTIISWAKGVGFKEEMRCLVSP